MKRVVLTIVSLATVCVMSAGRGLTAERPNILLIYTDDQGTLDAGCYGSRDLFTPNIDGLAAYRITLSCRVVGVPLSYESIALLKTDRT